MNYQNDSNHITEFFNLLPTGLDYIGSIDELDFYSNERIKNNVLDYIEQNPNTKRIKSAIESGMSKGNIFIGYIDIKGLGSLILKKLLKWNPHSKSINSRVMGFYDQKSSVGIVLDNNVDIMGNAVRDIPPILTHELIHFVANSDAKLFLNKTMYTYLLPYYKSLTEKVSEIEYSKNDLMIALIKLIKLESMNMYTNKQTLEYAYNIWIDYFKSITTSDELAKEYAMDILLPYVRFILNSLKFNKQKYERSEEVSRFMYDCYNEIGINNAFRYTMVAQEGIYPSEVVCIANQFNPSDAVLNIINSVLN